MVLRADNGAAQSGAKGDGRHYCSRQPEDNTNFRLGFASDVGTRDQTEMISDDYQ